MELANSYRLFGGEQRVYAHAASTTSCEMRFSLYLPESKEKKYPFLLWLSGLTCTEENFVQKAGAQRVANELGLALVAPDTSPRGQAVADDAEGAYDFGLGAGFYLDATQSPWQQHYQMRSYVENELWSVLAELPLDLQRASISGHSMGGHGALTMALRKPDRFRSVSAFAPICSPMHCPWGEKALSGYLGPEQHAWRAYDACALIEDGARVESILVDQGLADAFLKEQLKPELLRAACEIAGINLELRQHDGYDHSFYFIASFIESHLRWHAQHLFG